MRSQRVMWTALPNGLTSDGLRLRVSVFVSPRLRTDEGTTLDQFPDFENWPTTPITWTVRMGALAPITRTVVSAPPRSDVWNLLFPPNTPLTPYTFPSFSGLRVRSYPTANIRGYIRDFYVWLAQNHAHGFPALTDLVGAPTLPGQPPGPPGRLDAIRFGKRVSGNTTTDSQDAVVAQIESTLTSQLAMPAGPPNPAVDFTELKLFHQRDPVTGTPPPPTIPDFDFHQAVSLCGEHPPLLRILGLVFDLEVPVPSGGAQGPLWVVPTWTPKLTSPPSPIRKSEDILPRTAITASTFLASPRPVSPEVVDGYMQLEDPNRFSVVEVDLDTSALQLMDLARSLDRIVYGTDGLGGGSPASAVTDDTSSVTTLRSAGLTVARTGRAARFVTDAIHADALDASIEPSPPGTPTLFADDLTRGYRFDVWIDTRNRWFELYARVAGDTGGYKVGAGGTLTVPMPPDGDEGWVQLAVTSGQKASSTDLTLPEGTQRWAGWSLVAPRAGKVHATDPLAPLVDPPDNTPATFFKLQVSYAPKPGTLPTLRFGRQHRFRARAVDLAGNSVPFDPAANAVSFAHATAPITYRRFEPVPSPAILPRSLLTAGETAHRIVIRSNYNTPNGTVPHSQRHVLPQSMAQVMAEEHGLFDSTSGPPDPAKFAQIAQRDGATLTGGLPDPNNQNAPYFDVDTLSAPYFPDVLARGVAFEGMPGGPAAGTLQVPLYPTKFTWPESASLRIEVQAGKAGIGPADLPSKANKRRLRVRLPKATVATVRVSTFCDATDLDLLGVWGWVSEAGAATAALTALTLQGSNWLLNPYREIQLVHAVRQPLLAPALTGWSATRAAGSTSADLTGDVAMSRSSTNTLDIAASWSEPLDDPSQGAPTARSFDATFEHYTVQPDDPGGDVVHFGNGAGQSPLAQVFGDTKHRDVFYRVGATSRFVEYFREQSSVTLSGTTPSVLNGAGIVVNTDRVTSADGTTAYKRDTDYVVDTGTGTIARAASGSIGNGATVLVSFVAQPVARNSLEKPKKPATKIGFPVSVPSSASPRSIDLRHIVPSFAWRTTGLVATGTFRSMRAGGGLRIFAGRPWFTSGDGELLGVLVWNGALPAGPIPPEITVRGEDPLFGNILPGPHSSALALTDFPLATAVNTSVLGGSYSVAGHPVVYDSDRDLWFADIEVSEAALYSPFVRLALVRFQPASIAGAEVSPIVTTDPIKLSPTRMTARQKMANGDVKLTVTGPGPISVQAAPVQVRVEQRDATLPDEIGWNLVGAVQTLPPTSWKNGIHTWSGTITIPKNPTGALRLVVQEVEEYTVDPGSSTTGTRPVYLDTIPL